MASLPSFIAFLNDCGGFAFLNTLATRASPNPSTINALIPQLFIDDVMWKAEFDLRVLNDPNYPTIVHLLGLRIMVVLPTLQDGYNRQYADVVMSVQQGQANIEFNRFGPPCKSLNVRRINPYALFQAEQQALGQGCCSLPPFFPGFCCQNCNSPFYCDFCHTFSGIPICGSCCGQCCCFCNIHAPNMDKEAFSCAFLQRK